MEEKKIKVVSNEPCVCVPDFETFGGDPAKNGFAQLGASLVSLETGKLIATFSMYPNLKGYEIEERCYQQFWSRPDMLDKFNETLAKTKESPFTPEEVITKFHEWCTAWVAQYPNMFLATDCSTFDSGILKYFSRVKDTFYFLGELRDILDIGHFYLGIIGEPLSVDSFEISKFETCCEKLKCEYEKRGWELAPFDSGGVVHDHNPVNDSHYIALCLVYVNNANKKLKSK